MATTNKNKLLTVLLGLLAIGGLATMEAETTKSNVATPAKPPAQLAQENQRINDVANAAVFAQVLKTNQKDPDSFKLHSVGISPNGAACIDFSGTNSYGGRLRNSAVITRDTKTALAESQGNKFVAAWNLHCAKQPLTEELVTVQRLLSLPK